ncbi:class I adenylate-forming enzyme family protein [Nocardia sp. NPDC059091]|uniref:class I adenylate-forming enzyme family protein n=1 Tax=Nocardia sp. NPDC059091 TaxID=3346724 RepID=UPI0036931E22
MIDTGTSRRERGIPAVLREQLHDEPASATLVDLLTACAERTPDAEFLRFGEDSWTFTEVDGWTSRLAHSLIEDFGIQVGDRVAIMLPNIVQWPVVWLAALKAGAVVVPVNSSYQRADLTYVLRDSGARVVFSEGEKLALLEEVVAASGDLATLRIVDAVTHRAHDHPTVAPDVRMTGDNLANLQYTSGTTGFPKACMLTHDYWVRIGWVCAAGTGLGADDVLLTAQPFSYIDPQWNTALALTIGAPLVVLPRFSASGFIADVRRHRATFCYVLGAMPTLLEKQPPSPDDLDNDLRLVLCSAIPTGSHRRLEERWGAPWREVYGMTESGLDLLSFADDTADVGSGNLGRPVPNKQFRVVDAAGADVADGEPGELIIAGKPMMLGYWNRAEDTERTIRDGWLHTGDVVIRDGAGAFRLVGRIKDMVRRGGENVASAEVEGVLERLDDVVGAAVVGVPDDLLGEEVKAFVQLAAGVAADASTAERIIEHARRELARFKVPRYLEFVADFPRTPSARVAKPRLKARAAEQPGVTYDLGGRRRPVGD